MIEPQQSKGDAVTAFTLPLGIAALLAGLGATLIAGGLIAAAPPANAAASTEDSLSASAMDPSSLTARGNVAWYLPTRWVAAPVPT
jgi:hypothetical protein